MSIEQNLDKIIIKYKDIEEKLANADKLSKELYIQFSKEYSDLTPIIEKINAYLNILKEIRDLEVLVSDPEMKQIAEVELQALKEQLPTIEKNLQIALLPKDAADEKNAILEIRAGTGGDEAGLFAAQLYRMYQRFAENKGWKFEVMEISTTGIGGYKEATALVSGKGVFAQMKFESGVHRVQRVPETESSGRIHTSAATVAV